MKNISITSCKYCCSIKDICVLIILFCFSSGCAILSNRTIIEQSKAHRTAMEKAQNGDVAGGRKMMDDLVQKYPSVSNHFFRAAFITHPFFSAYQNTEDALEDWIYIINNKSLTFDKIAMLSQAYKGCSGIYLRQGNKIKALEYYDKYLEFLPALGDQLGYSYVFEEDFLVRGEKIILLLSMGDDKQTIAEFGKMLDNLSAAYQSREGKMGIQKGLVEDAMKKFKKAQELMKSRHYPTDKIMDIPADKLMGMSAKELKENYGIESQEIERNQKINALFNLKKEVEKYPLLQGKDLNKMPAISTYIILLGDRAVEPIFEKFSQKTPGDQSIMLKTFPILYYTASDNNRQRIVQLLLSSLKDQFEAKVISPYWQNEGSICFELTNGQIISISQGYFDNTTLQVLQAGGTVLYHEGGKLKTLSGENIIDFIHPVRTEAINALGDIFENSNNKMILSAIEEASIKSHIDARKAAVLALPRVSQKKTIIDFLEKAVDDSCFIVREQAVRELGRLKAKQSIEVLKRRLVSEKVDPVRQALTEAIEALK